MSIQELCGLTAQEITNKIMEQNGSNAFQISQASNNAYNSAIASYDATLAANKGITNNIVEASEAAFTSSVVASSLASVTSTLMLNTIVSNTSLLLLEKNTQADLSIEETFSYYWDKYSDLFGKIQIVYTNLDENGNIIMDISKIIENNIKYLNEYYSKGYRIFIGFANTPLEASVLPWFTTIGTEAKGISLNSNAFNLEFPKPIYNLQVTSSSFLEVALSIFSKTESSIYVVYSVFADKYIRELFEYNFPGRSYFFPVNLDSSNLTLENIKEFYKNSDIKSVTSLLLTFNEQRDTFLNLFKDSYPMPTPTYDTITIGLPIISESSKNALVDKYNYADNFSFSTSKLFREGLDSLKNNFFTNVPNALLLINKLAVNGNINTLPAHNSIIEFDKNNNIKYYTILNTIYSKIGKDKYYYKEEFYAVYDPIVGKQIFYINN